MRDWSLSPSPAARMSARSIARSQHRLSIDASPSASPMHLWARTHSPRRASPFGDTPTFREAGHGRFFGSNFDARIPCIPQRHLVAKPQVPSSRRPPAARAPMPVTRCAVSPATSPCMISGSRRKTGTNQWKKGQQLRGKHQRRHGRANKTGMSQRQTPVTNTLTQSPSARLGQWVANRNGTEYYVNHGITKEGTGSVGDGGSESSSSMESSSEGSDLRMSVRPQRTGRPQRVGRPQSIVHGVPPDTPIPREAIVYIDAAVDGDRGTPPRLLSPLQLKSNSNQEKQWNQFHNDIHQLLRKSQQLKDADPISRQSYKPHPVLSPSPAFCIETPITGLSRQNQAVRTLGYRRLGDPSRTARRAVFPGTS